MFTGIVEAIGTVKTLRKTRNGVQLSLKVGRLAKGLRPKESFCVDGVCLTVAQKKNNTLTFDLSSETLSVTTLGGLKEGERVNLERPLRLGDRLGGHLVQGHVDGLGTVKRLRQDGKGLFMEIGVPSFLKRYLVPRGSVAVQGVSLTVARQSKKRLGLFLIPETLKRTTLGQKRVGQSVNLEADFLLKYLRSPRIESP